MNDYYNIQAMSLVELRAVVANEEKRRKSVALDAARDAARQCGYDLTDLTTKPPRRGRGLQAGETVASQIFTHLLAGDSAAEACAKVGQPTGARAYQVAKSRGYRVVKGYLVKGDGL